MDLVVRTLYKTLVLSGVSSYATVDDVKSLLHQHGLKEQIPIPGPSKQRLVYKGAVLTSGDLCELGVRSGDHMVMLQRQAFAAPAVSQDTTPAPTAESIRAAILAEARRRGIEDTIVEQPMRGARHMGMPPLEAMGLDNQLLHLLQALGGRGPLGGPPGGPGGPRQPGGAAAPPAAGGQAAQQQAGAGAAAAGGARRNLQPQLAAQGGAPPPDLFLFGMPPLQAPQPQAGGAPPPPPPPPAPPAIPEPDAAAAAQLGEMGFGEAVSRKALLLHRNDVEAALNWLLQHGDDPAAAEPLTEEQLRQIYSRGPRGPPSEPELVEQLVAMGFERNQSAAALRHFRNMDLALAYLLRTAEEGGPGGAAAAGAGAGGAGAPAAAAGEQQAAAGAGGGQQAGGARQAAAGGAAGPEGGDGVELPELQESDSDGDGAYEEAVRGARQGPAAHEARDLVSDEDEGEEAEEGEEGEEAEEGEEGGHQSGAGPEAEGGQGAEHEGDGEYDVEEMEEEEMEEDEVEEGEQEDEEEDEEDEDDFMGEDGMPTMIEQLAVGQGAGRGRGTVLRVPLGAALGLGGGAPDDPIGGFGAPFGLFGGGAAGMGVGVGGMAAPAMAVTRGPDGNDLVLGSTGATMPPLMPAGGVMLGGAGGGVAAGGGGMGGLRPHVLDLPGLLGGGGPGGGGVEEDELLHSMGLVQQLLSAVLRDAVNGGEGGGPAPRGGR